MNSSIKTVIKKLWYKVRKLRYGRGYGSFGEGSIVRKPMRLICKRDVLIGGMVDVMPGLRMECVETCGGGKIAHPQIVFHDHVTVGQNCHITCANRIDIGEGTCILPEVVITDIEHKYEWGSSINDTGIEVGFVDISRNVSIGAGAKILGHHGIKIGENAVIGANAIVTKDVAAGEIVGGVPARHLGNINKKYW